MNTGLQIGLLKITEILQKNFVLITARSFLLPHRYKIKEILLQKSIELKIFLISLVHCYYKNIQIDLTIWIVVALTLYCNI